MSFANFMLRPNEEDLARPHKGRWLWSSWLALAIFIGAGGWLFYKHQSAKTLALARESLQTMADLKAVRISDWLKERRGDAEVTGVSLIAKQTVTSPGNAVFLSAAKTRAEDLRQVYDYAAVVFADAQGKVQLKVPADYPLSASFLAENLRAGGHSRKVTIGDLSRDGTNGPILMCVRAPIVNELETNSPILGTVLLVIDPRTFFYPMLQQWPVPSRTAEVAIVRREGDEIICLNDLRSRTNTALNLRMPLAAAKADMPAVMALQGIEGVVEGRDYRGIPVIAVLRQIPEMSWCMAAKIDREEVLAPLRWEALQAGTIAGLILLTAGLVVGLFWRQQKLAAVRENELRLRALIEEAPVAISVSRGGKTIYVNRKFLQLYGYSSAQELVGRPVTIHWAPAFREIIAENVRRRAAGEHAPKEYEGMAQRQDGSQFHVWIVVDSVELPDGQAAIAFLEDISKRKQAEEHDARLASIVASSEDAIVSKTLRGIITSWNRGAEKLFGYHAEEVVGKSILVIFPPDRVEEETAILASISRGETIEHYETVRVAKGGKQIDVSETISPIRNVSGEIIGVSKIARDITERKRTEQSLRLFRALLDHANDSIEVIDPQTGRFLDVNQMSGQAHGYTREEYLAMRVMDIDPRFATEGADFWNAHVENLQRHGVLHFETEHKRKDGSVFPVQINATYVRLEQDYIIAVVRDITEAKKTDRQIHRLNRLYAMLSGINVLIVHERDQQKLFASACEIAVREGKFQMAWIGLVDEARQILKPVAAAGVVDGYLDTINIDLKDPVRRAGISGSAILSGEHQVCNDIKNYPRLQPWCAAALQRGYLASTAFPLKVNGKVVGAFTLYAPEVGFFDREELQLLDELAGDISFALEVNQKETARQQAEDNLRESEKRFRLLIENASDIIMVINREGVIQFVSPSVKPTLGYEPADMLGKAAWEFIAEADADRVLAAHQKTLADPAKTVSVEYSIRHKNGGWRILQSIGRSLPDFSPDGFVVLNSRDVTENRSLEEQIRQAQKMECIGQLAGGVAHDFNNILAVIMMQAHLTATGEGTTEEAKDGLLQIKLAAERAANLTRQLLLFSRKQVMQSRRLDLNEAVTNLAKMLQRLIGAPVHLQLHLHNEPLTMVADAGMIDQVLLNLAVNARDAMPQGGVLLIETKRVAVSANLVPSSFDAAPGNYACLSVTDSGTGIAPEILPRIFEPFFTTKEPGKGTGLGLATVFGIVKQHHGFISVESAVGHGTTFLIYLPVKEANAEPSATSQPKIHGGSETILLAEDDSTLRPLMRLILERNGYKVLECANGNAALQQWEQHHSAISLLLTDLVMPGGVSGQELARRLQREKPELKVIYCSGYNAEMAGHEIKLKLGENFFQKPIHPDQLLELVRQSLDARP